MDIVQLPNGGVLDGCVLLATEHILAINKPAGLVVHPAYRHPNQTLADYVFARETALGRPRPWLLHRLDRDTSGVVLFARSPAARRSLVRQFECHTITKRYLAVTQGWSLSTDGILEAPLRRDPSDRRRVVVASDGQQAVTSFRVLAQSGGLAWLVLETHTGRTHQIRAHCAAAGAPLAGDTLYGYVAPATAPVIPRVMLHAWSIEARMPAGGGPLKVVAPLPDDVCQLLRYYSMEDIAGFAPDPV